ncbi:MAG: phytanoyl-CoA dioxygenase family protein [Myxococcota bacterium]
MGSLESDGFALLKSALPGPLVESLRATCDAILARTSKPRMRVPLEWIGRRPFNDPRLLALARGGRIRGLWIRCAPPGGREQAVHRDASFSPAPPTWLSADVLLTPFTASNGATEIWPGSHAIEDFDDADRARTAERAAARPSLVVVGEPGDVVVRNPRVWHRAGANRTHYSRTLLSVEYALDRPLLVDRRHHAL